MAVKKLLLVEDNKINAEIVIGILEELGIEYDVAEDGQKAVEACIKQKNSEYRMILMDVHMPILNGYQASRIIKEDLKVSSPIILCTATTFSGDEARGSAKYIDGVIPKPLNIDGFCRVLKQYFC